MLILLVASKAGSGGRIYRYYVTREVIAGRLRHLPLTSMPAADVEGAVLDYVHKLLAAPELVTRT